MAKIRIGLGSEFNLKDQKVGLGTNNPQERLDVADVAKGKDLKVTGISSFTAYEGFLRADHQIAENTTLSFDQGPSASLSGEIIVGTGQTVTINTVQDDPLGPELITNGNFDSDVSGWTAGTDTAVALDGGRIKITNSASVYGSAYQDITVVPGETYVINAHYAGGTGSGNYHVGDAVTSNKYLSAVSGKKAFTPESTTVRVVLNVGGNTSGHYVLFDSITVKKENNVSDKTTRAGGSEVECLKVYNTFTPPSGGTNERPYAPKPGELYYNYDFKTIEFFDGYGWRQVDNTTRSGRAVFAGGQNPGNLKTISYLNINSQGNEEYFGDLDGDARTGLGIGQVSSSIRGVFGSGYVGPTIKDEINYVTIASAGNAIDFGNLSVARGWAAAFSSSTRGIWATGFTAPTSVSNNIDYVEISTLGNALDFGDSSTTRDGAGGVSNPTRGIFGAGVSGSPFPGLSSIEYVTISSKGDSVNFGDLTQRRRQPATACNSVRGIFAGGLDDPNVNTYQSIIDFITMSSVGNAIEFGDLTIDKRDGAGASTQVRAVFSAGLVNPSPTYTNIIDFITISSTGDAQDFGDSIVGRNSHGTCSDSHGGLGGF